MCYGSIGLLCSDISAADNHYLDFFPQYFLEKSTVICTFKWKERREEHKLLTNMFSGAPNYSQSCSNK